jgi:hypothetical protein
MTAKAKPTLQVPGAKAQAKDKPDAAPVGFTDHTGDDDDLKQFETDDLPPAAPPSVQELQEALAKSLAVQRRQQTQIDALLGRAEGAQANVVPLPTVDEAIKLAAKDIAAGKRPRPTLTVEGWYCHPEMARVAVHGEKK